MRVKVGLGLGRVIGVETRFCVAASGAVENGTGIVIRYRTKAGEGIRDQSPQTTDLVRTSGIGIGTGIRYRALRGFGGARVRVRGKWDWD